MIYIVLASLKYVRELPPQCYCFIYFMILVFVVRLIFGLVTEFCQPLVPQHHQLRQPASQTTSTPSTCKFLPALKSLINPAINQSNKLTASPNLAKPLPPQQTSSPATSASPPSPSNENKSTTSSPSNPPRRPAPSSTAPSVSSPTCANATSTRPPTRTSRRSLSLRSWR